MYKLTKRSNGYGRTDRPQLCKSFTLTKDFSVHKSSIASSAICTGNCNTEIQKKINILKYILFCVISKMRIVAERRALTKNAALHFLLH